MNEETPGGISQNSKADVTFGANAVLGASAKVGAKLENYYHVECIKPDGTLRWELTVPNIMVTAGLNILLDSTLKTGVTSPTWYVGLVDNASWTAYAAADTMASHGGWIEGVPYSNATRVAFTPGAVAAGSVDNSASKASFSINATLTVRGAFLVNNSTKSGTTGTLYGEADFASSRAVISGDTLNVQVTATAS